MLRIVQIIFTCSKQDQTIDYFLTLSYKMQAQNDLNKLFAVALFDSHEAKLEFWYIKICPLVVKNEKVKMLSIIQRYGI